MSGLETEKDFSICLDPVGQLPGLHMYTQLCFCFSVPGSTSYPAVIDTLRYALEQLSAGFPWIAGQVVNEGSGKGSSGIFKIEPMDSVVPSLVVKDLRDDPSVPTLDSMRRAHFPFTMLDESVIAPRNTFPGSHGETVSEAKPVFLLQACIITGGFLLTFLGQHQVMDMAGQAQMIYLFSKACRGEDFTREELISGNLSRHNHIPLLDDFYKPGSELYDQIVEPPNPDQTLEGTIARPASPPRQACAYFTFSKASLDALKSFTTESLPPSSAYITTDDALSAFIWQSVSRVRLYRLPPAELTAFARAVDVRQLFGVPQTYPGILHNMTYHRYSLQGLVKEPLGAIASQLRSAIDPKTSQLEYNTRALATFLDRSPDKSSVSFLAKFGPSSDIMLSSWARENCYSFDFGPDLGRPEAVRRPRFEADRTLIYFMPKTLDGEVAVGVLTRMEDIERLREDREFMKFATYVG